MDTGRRGRVAVVSTPIGHLEDLSPRARRTLEEADVVACEDTRRTGLLLSQLGIKKRLVSMHEHNERRRLPQLMEALLEEGLTVAVVSDAGTPLVSDPGFLLVREAAAAGVAVEPVPGASAILAALVASALPPYPFTFLGFAPSKKARRRTFLTEAAELGHTILFFESPHRICACLEDAAAALGERPAAVCRELTKLHEEVLRGTPGELAAELGSRPGVKGEIVVVIGPAPKVRR
ncbi:MAG: 16S rRNA (cytidine(1402)-2'-O)-methyltransferase [Acidobacteriota bacterium]